MRWGETRRIYVKLPIFSEYMENSARFMKNSASKSLKLDPTQGLFNSWSGDQLVMANILELELFGPSLLPEKVHQVRYGRISALKLKLHTKSTYQFQYFTGFRITFGKNTVFTS